MTRNGTFSRGRTNGRVPPEGGVLTGAEGVDVLVELEAHDRTVVVDEVGLAVPGARHHLLSAVSLHTEAGTFERRIYFLSRICGSIREIVSSKGVFAPSPNVWDIFINENRGKKR